MGYYTRHVLRVYKNNDKDLQKKLFDAIKKISGYEFTSDDDRTIDDRTWNDGIGCKWYDYHKDILEISKILGNDIIYCWLEGEDNYEREYLYKNGEEISCHTHSLGWSWEECDNDPHENDYGELKDNPQKDVIVGDYKERVKHIKTI